MGAYPDPCAIQQALPANGLKTGLLVGLVLAQLSGQGDRVSTQSPGQGHRPRRGAATGRVPDDGILVRRRVERGA